VLVALPFAIDLPRKAAAGQTMLDDLHSLMQPASVNKTVYYFDGTFVPLRPLAVEAVAAGGQTPKLISALAPRLHMTPAQLEKFLGANFPATAALLGALPALAPTFANVPPGLTHYQPLVRALKDNVGNYAQVASLPDLRLFTWILAIPGLALIVLAAGLLRATRRVSAKAVSAPAM
jgi:hypothetical protein